MDLTAYSHALAALALWAILISILAAYSTIGRTDTHRCECGRPKRDYADPIYRRERAFMNAVEAAGPFIAATVAAILIGANPFMVNLFASLFIAARVVMAVVHIMTENQAMRSLFFMVGFISILGQAVLAFFSAF